MDLRKPRLKKNWNIGWILQLTVLILSTVTLLCHNAHGSRKVKSKTHPAEDLEYVTENVAKLQKLLKPCYTTNEAQASSQTTNPEDWWKKNQESKTEDDLGIAIVVENYSKYRLTDPLSHQSYDSKTLIQPGEIYGGHYATIAYEKYNNKLLGSVSWQIEENNGVPVKWTGDAKYGLRLNIAYSVPWKGACSEKVWERDAHSIQIAHTLMSTRKIINGTTFDVKAYWAEANKKEGQKDWHKKTKYLGTDFTPKHRRQFFVEFEMINRAPNQYKYLVHSNISAGGCRPILKVQLLPGMGYLNKNSFYTDLDNAQPPSPKQTVQQRPLDKVTAHGVPCKVPFKKDKDGPEYYNCIVTSKHPWCATTVNNDKTYYNWNWC